MSREFKKTIMKLKFIVTMLVFCFLFTSCATVFTGSRRSVLFETEPAGAKVYVNGFEKGIAPVQLKVKKDDRIDFKLEGFKEKVVIMDADFNLVSIINGFSIIGWGIDAISGSLQRVNTKYVKVSLDKNAVAVNNYLEKGNITKVAINTDTKTIETTIVLAR